MFFGKGVNQVRGPTGSLFNCSTGPLQNAVVLAFAQLLSAEPGEAAFRRLHRCNDDGDKSETHAFRLSSVHSLAFVDLVWYLHGIVLLMPLPLDELVAQTQLAPWLRAIRVFSSILTAGPLFFISLLRAAPVPSPATSIHGCAMEDRPNVLLVEARVAADSSAAAGAVQVRDRLTSCMCEDTGQALCVRLHLGTATGCNASLAARDARAYAQCLIFAYLRLM